MRPVWAFKILKRESGAGTPKGAGNRWESPPGHCTGYPWAEWDKDGGKKEPVRGSRGEGIRGEGKGERREKGGGEESGKREEG